MKEFTMVFKTRHRKDDEVERDCMLICRCLNTFTIRCKYLYNGKDLIIFHIYDTDKKQRCRILVTILGKIHYDTDYQSLDLQSYTS